jgi:hypothetical protein
MSRKQEKDTTGHQTNAGDYTRAAEAARTTTTGVTFRPESH